MVTKTEARVVSEGVPMPVCSKCGCNPCICHDRNVPKRLSSAVSCEFERLNEEVSAWRQRAHDAERDRDRVKKAATGQTWKLRHEVKKLAAEVDRLTRALRIARHALGGGAAPMMLNDEPAVGIILPGYAIDVIDAALTPAPATPTKEDR